MQYQLLPSLSAEDYDALKNDIALRGVQVPIEFDEKGNVLDGHHRLMACQELGITQYPSMIRVGMSEAEKIHHVLALNLDRRHLGKEERTVLEARLRERGWSYRQISETAKIPETTVRRDLSGAPNGAPQPARTTGRDGKQYSATRKKSTTVVAKNKQEQQRTFEALDTLPDGTLPNSIMDTRRVERLAREHKSEERANQVNADCIVGTAKLILGDFRERGSEIPDASIDMIFTDPPYPKDYLPLWSDLSKLAARVLKQDGILIAYTGAMFLPEVITRLDEHLLFWWAGTIILDGPHSRVHARNVSQGSKPLLFFVRKDYKKSAAWIEDTYRSEGEQKENHDWQQSMGAAKHYISKLTNSDAVILDPFLGGGTTGQAALETGRNFIGIEIDPIAFNSSKERLENG